LKLFKEFGFLNSTKELNSNGVGLGLYICKRMALIFGGRVGVESQVGRGSMFFFSFKLEDSSDVSDGAGNRLLNPNKMEHKKIVITKAKDEGEEYNLTVDSFRDHQPIMELSPMTNDSPFKGTFSSKIAQLQVRPPNFVEKSARLPF